MGRARAGLRLGRTVTMAIALVAIFPVAAARLLRMMRTRFVRGFETRNDLRGQGLARIAFDVAQLRKIAGRGKRDRDALGARAAGAADAMHVVFGAFR